MSFYVYAYLRENLTPYYIGKGKGNRAWVKGNGEVYPPINQRRIRILRDNLTETEAFALEIALILQYGRKDIGTGILRNKSNGGEGPSGAVRSNATRIKMSMAHKNKKLTDSHKKKLSEAHRGKTLTAEHKEKIRLSGLKRFIDTKERQKVSRPGAENPNASVWKITKPDGTTFYVTGLSSWCKENNIPRDRIRLSQCGWVGENLGKKKFLKKE
jgi:hypothetical protein